ncbi:DUF2029 domain-containing protein [Agromyces intestinalis]|uniref:DUF2029 domain-containing protein n=1 Tax=Agromyces intestinalis TaxID=2592652 RepID=A0A5C1YL67_9MICO|nr:DUF2029 domain-containing protein [Agromyces intestinalis]
MSGRAVLWIGFAVAHLVVALLGLYGMGWPLGDLVTYRVWAEEADLGVLRMGIDAPWVYPILAFAPMAAALALGHEWYEQAWLVIVTGLDAIAFAVLLGRGVLARGRRIAAWWWMLFIVLLGPVALGRIDAVTVPFAVAGLLFALGRPRVAATLLTVGAWIKVWPAALIGAIVVASRRRSEVALVAAALSAGVLGVSLLAGSGLNALGFVGEQTGRGLQVEAPGAVPFLWMIAAGDRSHRVYYDRDILTYQLAGAGVTEVAWWSTPLLVVGVTAVVLAGVRAVRHGATAGRLLAPLSLAVVIVLILANKVGSPQFATWLIAPIVLQAVLARRRVLVPALAGLGVALSTQLIYPYLYGWLLIADPALVLVLTLKVALLALLLGWALVAVWQAGSAPERRVGRPVGAARSAGEE